jgi:hypothetical protein
MHSSRLRVVRRGGCVHLGEVLYEHWMVLASAAPVTHLEFAMNIELDEVVIQDVSDDALELAAGGAQGGRSILFRWCAGG